MLFDLRGKRRRAVQATYLILAILMGGGLVLFGIGGSGGNIFDAFDSSSGDSGNEQLEKRIDRLETKLQTSPNDAVTLAALVKANYQVAVSQTPSGTTAIPEEGKDDLRKAGQYWERYVTASNSEPSPDLAKYALNVYSPEGLNQPAKAKEAVRILAADANDAQTYLLLVQYATAAKDTRTAKLAAQKAVELAPKNQRKEVEKAAEQLQNAAPQQQ
jgi:cytochrome c-type biogenesis protein CcmH/NrfG